MNKAVAKELVAELSRRAFLRGRAYGQGRACPPNLPSRKREERLKKRIVDALCSVSQPQTSIVQSAETLNGRLRR